MGWDISYHPIAVDEIQSIYFKGLEDKEYYKFLAKQFEVNGFYTEQMRIRFEEARNIDRAIPFNKGHAYYIAIISGFLRKYWYIRGGAFSFLTDDAGDAFINYISDWKQLVPKSYQNFQFDNKLTENYCGGVFINNAALKHLRNDYQSNSYIHNKLNETFSGGRLNIFWEAVDYAINNNLGLLEASEIIEPNPLDLNSSKSLTNLFNCVPDGAILYAEASMQQLAEAMKSSKKESPPQKKSWISKLFGK